MQQQHYETSFDAAAAPRVTGTNMFHIQYRKIGGIRYLRIGKLCLSLCLTERPLKQDATGRAPYIY